MKERFFIGLAITILLLAIIASWLQYQRTDSEMSSHYPPLPPPRTTSAAGDVQRRHAGEQRPNQSSDHATSLKAGGKQWGLSFEDEALDDSDRVAIASDLNVVFGHAPQYEIDPLLLPVNIQLGNTTLCLDKRIRFTGADVHRPPPLHDDGFGCVIDDGTERSLFVPKAVTDAYRQAIARERHYSPQYGQLHELIDSLNHLADAPIAEANKLFMLGEDFPSSPADLAALSDEDFPREWGGHYYRQPSILDVIEATETPLGKYGTLVAKTYRIVEGRLDELPPLVYNDGQWRLLMLRPGT